MTSFNPHRYFNDRLCLRLNVCTLLALLVVLLAQSTAATSSPPTSWSASRWSTSARGLTTRGSSFIPSSDLSQPLPHSLSSGYQQPPAGSSGADYLPVSTGEGGPDGGGHRRLLQADEWSPIIVPLSHPNQSVGNDYVQALDYVFKHLSPVQSAFVLFPYSFALSNASHSSYPQGAFVSTSDAPSIASSLPSATSATDFQYVLAVQDLLLASSQASVQSQAVYDSSIAIFIAYGVLPSDPTLTVRMLTNEAPNVCQALYGSIAGKWTQCWQSAAWLAYLASSGTHEATSIVYVTASDLASGLLFNPTQRPRFGSLIFPDLYFGSAPTVLSNLTATSAAVQQVHAYVQAGGTIITSGKGALIAQGLGLITSPTTGLPLYSLFDNSSELVSASDYTSVATVGCEQEGASSASTLTDLDFTHRVVCFSLGTGLSGSITTALISSPPLNLSVLAQTSLSTLSSFNTAATPLLVRGASGISTAVSALTNLPHTLYTTIGQGQLLMHLSNPPISSAAYPWLYNSLFLSNVQPVLIEFAFPSNEPDIIPALEQVAVTMQLQVANLLNDPFTPARLLIWPASGVAITAAPAGCTLLTNASGLTAPATGLNSTATLDCSPASGSLAPLSTWQGSFTVFIQNVLVTQTLSNIVLLHPQVTYTLASRGGLSRSVDLPLTVSAYAAAELVGDYNADPTGFYPLLGSGQFVDNVLTMENKQATTAFFFSHTALVPLITPLVDISLQSQVVRYLTFDALYYEESNNGMANYQYPQPAGPFSASSPAPYDLLDYVLLNLRGDSLAANWDEPIYPTKQARNSSFPNYPPTGDSGVANISLAQYDSSVNSEYIVVTQTAFGDAQSYFTYPSPRLMAFLDATLPVPFRTYSAGVASLPSYMINAQGNGLKHDLGFASNTIYFYPQLNGGAPYPLPAGVPNANAVLSLDRYNDSTAACNPNAFSGAYSKRTVTGYYNSADANHSPPGMLPNEYSNGVLAWCVKQQNLLNASTLSARSNASSALTHYVVVLSSNPELRTGDDAMFMVPDPAHPNEWYYAPSTVTGQARYGDYPELRMAFVMTASFPLADAISYRGGQLSFTLPAGWGWAAGVDPVASDYITWSADGISFVSTQYTASTGLITSMFYRGELPSENAGSPSQLQVNLERLVYSGSASPVPTTFAAPLQLSQMLYDLSAPPTFETFTPVPSFSRSLTFTRSLALSLPAVRLSFQYRRTPTASTPLTPSSVLNPFKGLTSNLSYVLAFEDDSPFVRYGVYTQELMAHRTVYGSQQFNPVSDTGLVTVSGGFSYITNLGESSIPYRQYLTTGAGQLIPSTSTTGRFSWQDLWGRQMVEPVRSLFVDAAPLPGPLRNFQMTTTFELLNPATGQRQLDWYSESPVTVRVQMKLLNNYDKWWVLTTSKQNELQFTAGQSYPGYSFVTAASSYPNQLTAAQAAALNSGTTYLQYGYQAEYGNSLGSGSVWLSGVQLNASQEAAVRNAIYCVSNYTAACASIGSVPIPTRQPSTAHVNPPNSWWNYASAVASYWPAGYIDPTMWGLTAETYDDNVFDYGYNYQFDNRLPSLDNGGLLAPQNVLSFPVYAGTGYAMTYSPSLSHPRFPGKAGWWSDQLQNKDDTLLAGQNSSNAVSVGAQDLTLQAGGWVDLTQLNGTSAASTASLTQAVDGALSNIYTCLFNRKRIATRANSPLIINPANTLQNNVVPVDPTLTKTDARLTQFNCAAANGGQQYTAETISQYDNYAVTNSASDYLYFAAQLRGGALEDVNVLYTLSPISTVQQEGLTTVQEGGQLVYWNPALGPNAYEQVTDPVSNVRAMRTDLTWTEALYPAVATTFQSTVFQLLTLTDPAEVNNAWALATSDQQYGFGDAAVRTLVGGNQGTSCVVNPGGSTIVQVDFYNNAGFDWELLQGAIWSQSLGQLAYSATVLQSGVAPVIQAPTAYNFMSVQVPSALQPYLTITPSQIYSGQAPLEFDFTTNNVATIRDGYQGSYFYSVKVSASLPPSLLGRVYELPIALNSSYFQALPGYNDPTGIHDYTLSIPPIVLAMPYPNGSQWAGSAYHVNARAFNLTFNHQLDTAFRPIGAVTVSLSDVVALQALSAQSSLSPSQLTAFWTSLNHSWNVPIPMTVVPQTGSLQSVQLNFSAVSPTGQFPIPQAPVLGPDPAQVYILLNTFAQQLQPVYANRVTQRSAVSYTDWMNVTKSASVSNEVSVYAQGPFLTVTYHILLLDDSLAPLPDQGLYCGDSGVLRMLLTVQNIGTAFAYDVTMAAQLNNTRLNVSIVQPANVGLTVNVVQTSPSTLSVHANTSQVLEAGGVLTAVLLLSYSVPQAVNGSCPTTLLLATGAQCQFAFFATGELTVQQNISTTYVAPISQLARLAVSVNVSQSAANSSLFLLTASPPNAPLSSVLSYLNTSAVPAVASSADWAFAYQVSALLTVPNRYNNGTVQETVQLATVFASTQPLHLNVTIPSDWESVSFQVVLGVSDLLSPSNTANTNIAGDFVPAQAASAVYFTRVAPTSSSSSSSSHTALIVEIVVPVVVGLALLATLAICFACTRRGKESKQADKQWHRTLPTPGAVELASAPPPSLLMTGVAGVVVVDLDDAEMDRRRQLNASASERLRGRPYLPQSRPAPPLPVTPPEPAPVAPTVAAPPLPASRPSLPSAAPVSAPPPALPSVPPRLSRPSAPGVEGDTMYEGETETY